MNDIPLAGGDLVRSPVLCARCGDAWDERLVPDASAAGSDAGLCPSCLLTTSHGEQPPTAAASDLVEPYPA